MPKLQVFLPDGGGEVSHELTGDTVTIGRLPDNTIQIDNISVSSHHRPAHSQRRGLSLEGPEFHEWHAPEWKGRHRGPIACRRQGAVREDRVCLPFEIQAPDEKREMRPAEVAAVSVAASSVRPSGFLQRLAVQDQERKTSGSGAAVISLAVLSMSARGAAVAFIMMMQPPQ